MKSEVLFTVTVTLHDLLLLLVTVAIATAGFVVIRFAMRPPTISQSSKSSQVEWSDESVECLLNYLLIIGRLKTAKRTGWINHNIDLPESIADHMYRMAVLSLMVCNHNIGGGSVGVGVNADMNRCVSMSIVHDMIEAVCGDIPPPAVSGVSKERKHKIECDAMQTLQSTLFPPRHTTATNALESSERSHLKQCSELLHGLWTEYESASTPEASLLKDLDKFEMILTAYEYERDQPSKRGGKLDSFYRSVDGKIKHPIIRALERALLKRRTQLSSLSSNSSNNSNNASNVATDKKSRDK